MPTTFSERIRTLLDAKNFAVVATLNPDGGPQTSVVWYVRDGDTLAFTATAARRKVRNLSRDPRVSLTVYDLANPYHSVEVRGTASVGADPDHELQYRVSHRYTNEDPPPDPEGTERVAVRVAPERVVEFGG